MKVHLRFGMHRDIELIHSEKHNIDGLVIPGNILAHQTPSTSAFIMSMPDIPYFIDPMTFMFQNKLGLLVKEGTKSFRPSIQKLCDCYQLDFSEAMESLSLEGLFDVVDFPNPSSLAQQVTHFQQSAVGQSSGTSSVTKYLERYSSTKVTLPRIIVPPYFFFSHINNDWYKISLRCAKNALKNAPKAPIAPVICCSTGCLDDTGIAAIASDYNIFDNIILWIDNFIQTDVSWEEIFSVRKLIKKLKEAGADQIESLYGGYLLMLCRSDGLDAISQGILYTQNKTITMTPGSGGPPERYYIPAFREFRSMSQTDLILHKHPELLCDCPVCKKHLAGNPDNIILFRDNPELLRRHFLAVRRQEADRIDSNTIDDEVAELKDIHKKYNKSISLLPNPDAFVSQSKMSGLDYLLVWAKALKESM
jgi:hypothetical protein